MREISVKQFRFSTCVFLRSLIIMFVLSSERKQDYGNTGASVRRVLVVLGASVKTHFIFVLGIIQIRWWCKRLR